MDIEIGLDTTTADQTSQVFLGRWQGLISTTNWEKGRIIHEWRQALIASGALAQQYSDEAWSRRVGQVTGQHAGRLRRVYERFQAVRESYPGLFWSHFQAALDWDDAELWLEGGVQNSWSISDMRGQRWEAFGGAAGQRPDEEDTSAELDEDFQPIEAESIGEVRLPSDGDRRNGALDETDQNTQAGMPFDAAGLGSAMEDDAMQDVAGEDHAAEAEPAFAPFENLRELPTDLTEAFESFKLAILRHKLAGWQEVSRGDVLASLEALKQLAAAPA